MRRMMEVVDGEYQTIKSKDGAYVREHFFNTPELKELVADYTDDDIWKLNRGGHDPFKVYAALPRGGQPQGPADGHPRQDDQGLRDGRVRRGAEHHAPAEEDVARLDPAASATASASRSPTTSWTRCPTSRSRKARPSSSTCARAGWSSAAICPRGAARPTRSSTPELAAFERFLKSTEDREISTTMAFVQILQLLLRDKNLGKHIVPIVPDESRTFGMEGLFRQLGIWNQQGQLYTPQDSDQLMFYKEIEERTDPAGRHQRGRRDVRLDRGGDVVLDARRADDPVLHLLLDVRLPARRRPRVGGGRHALARLPAGRHRRDGRR